MNWMTALLALLVVSAFPSAAAAQQSGTPAYAYDVEAVNPGLPAPGANVLLETPQSLLETFWYEGEEGDWNAVAQTLDLSALPPAAQARLGPELAEQLHTVVKRSMLIDWNGLPDRPDGLDANASTKDPMAGTARRNIRLTSLRLPTRTVSVRIARVKPQGGDPVWLFSTQTVDNIPALYDRFGPTAVEKRLPSFLRKQAFWTLAWWEVIALPLTFLLALAAAGGTFVVFRRAASRVGDSLPGKILHLLRFPASLFAFVGTFVLVRETVFVFSGVVKDALDPLQTLLMVVAIAAIVLQIIEAVLDMIRERRIDDISDPQAGEDRNLYTGLSAVRRLFIVLAMLIGAAFVIFGSGMSNTLGFSALASAGVLGLVLAFAARSALANVMASMQIAFSKAARVGDAVLWDDQWSFVEDIGLTYVQLRTWADRRLLIPVEKFASEPFENWTKEDPSLLRPVSLFLDHRTDIGKLREAFFAFVKEDEGVICEDEAVVEVIGHSERAMEVRFMARSPDPSTGWDMHCRLRERMLAAAAELDTASEPGADTATLPREREVKIGE